LPRAISRRQVEAILAAPPSETLMSIADRVGVSKSTVSCVRSDPKWYLTREDRGMRGKRVQVKDKYLHVNPGDAERCPGCGYRVLMPCEYCRQESLRESWRKGL
jgi:hypothetical protein